MRFDGVVDTLKDQLSAGCCTRTSPRSHLVNHRSIPRRALAGALGLAVISGPLLLTASPASAATTFAATGRVSVTSAGTEVKQPVGSEAFLDRTGRFVAFESSGAYTSGDTNNQSDVFVRDRLAGTTERVSLTDADKQILGTSDLCGLSRNGRFVGFVAEGQGLPVPSYEQVYVRDREEGTTTLVSVDSNEVPSQDSDFGIETDAPCPVSDDGRFTAFSSSANGLVPGEADGSSDVFRRDRVLGTTQQMSLSAAGLNQSGYAEHAAMSADGAVVAFHSSSSTLVQGDTNNGIDVFLRLTASSSTVRVSVKTNGTQANGESKQPTLSSDGSRIVFTSTAPDLVGDDANEKPDVFVVNRNNSVVVRASVRDDESESSGASDEGTISDDGRYVAFSSNSANLEPGDQNAKTDTFRRDVLTGATDLVSRAPGGPSANGESESVGISADGSVIAFTSSASDLVRNDTPGYTDAFVRDLGADHKPFASMDGFVKQQYLDFEGRHATAAEVTEATARLTNGEVSPDGFIDEHAHGTAWAGKRAPLIRLYWAFFLRAPDLGGLDYWTKKLSTGTSLANVAKQFAASSEFQTKYGSKTNQQFVTLIYQNIFDRDPDAEGLAFWTKRLDTKTKTRGDVMTNFSESSEGRRVLAPQTDTVLIYLGMLRTMPSKAVIASFQQELGVDHEPPENVAAYVRQQGAYLNRFGA